MRQIHSVPHPWCILPVVLLLIATFMVQPPERAYPAGLLVLYEGTQGGTPDSQGLFYQTNPEVAPASRQIYQDGATILDTTEHRFEWAGYTADPAILPALDQSDGFAVHFTVQILAEDHTGSDKNGNGIGDRAGFSVLVLDKNSRGIELGFWEDRIWAQEDGPAEPPHGTLFTQAEGHSFDTTTRMTTYELRVLNGSYTLTSAGTPILSGRLRDYRSFSGPVNPYRSANVLFWGDNTGSAQVRVQLSYLALLPQLPLETISTPTSLPDNPPTSLATSTPTLQSTGTPTDIPTIQPTRVPIDHPTSTPTKTLPTRPRYTLYLPTVQDV